MLATACGGLAYLVGVLVFHGSWRVAWAVLGLVVCGLPAYVLWSTFRRLSRAAATISSTAAALRSLLTDREAREAIYELADSREDTETASLISLGKELLRLRKAIASHREQAFDLWQTITAVTTLPGMMALGIVGSFGLLICSVVAVLVSLAF